YQRSFLSIAEYLKSESKLSEREINSLFIKGLEKTFKTEVMAQLKAENPWHRAGDPYSIKEVASAAIYILASDPSLMQHSEAPSASNVKKETYDLSQGFQIGGMSMPTLISEIVKQLNFQNSEGHKSVRLRSSNFCIFCSDPDHFVNACPKAKEYLQKGLCRKDNEGKIVAPNGDRIFAKDVPGKNIMERLDNWHK
ncbi:hypothetical protein BYT27DRAFT_7072743, partial [Phlegmacium glaucopus]